MRPRTAPQADDGGFTLIEVLVVMVISSIMLSLSVTGWQRYQRQAELRQVTDRVVSVLRNAQQAAYAEATTYCVRLGTTPATYEVVRPTCAAGATIVTPTTRLSIERVVLQGAAFKQPDGTTSANVQFTPRGSASAGSLVVRRADSTGRTYKISVEGLTARVAAS